jgi:hypothetical protein
MAICVTFSQPTRFLRFRAIFEKSLNGFWLLISSVTFGSGFFKHGCALAFRWVVVAHHANAVVIEAA